MPSPLSKTMREAVAFAREKGDGTLTRFPGGFWSIGGFGLTSNIKWFGTPTVEALVTRGVAEYTNWQVRGNGTRFPIEITLLAV